jgi:hypothetical protein
MSLDIYRIPLYYISFKRKEELEKELTLAGFKDVNMFKAIHGFAMDAKTLRKDNVISARSYNDLMTHRQQHSGIPSLGAIGCALSHYSLWKKCVDDDLDYIIIVEDDLKVERISAGNIDKIRKILRKDRGLYISSLHKPVPPLYEFWGAHFYIASKSACEELIKHMFPIDIQVDYYIGHLKSLGYINLEGFPIYRQYIRFSSVQDLCLSCYVTNGLDLFIVFLLIYFIASVVYAIFP